MGGRLTMLERDLARLRACQTETRKIAGDLWRHGIPPGDEAVDELRSAADKVDAAIHRVVQLVEELEAADQEPLPLGRL